MPKNPVCIMDVDETTAKYVSEYKGKKYFFLCSWLQGDVRQRSGEIRLSPGSRRMLPNCQSRTLFLFGRAQGSLLGRVSK
jgi:hypothetical protein